jgi:hypothetical protein
MHLVLTLIREASCRGGVPGCWFVAVAACVAASLPVVVDRAPGTVPLGTVSLAAPRGGEGGGGDLRFESDLLCFKGLDSEECRTVLPAPLRAGGRSGLPRRRSVLPSDRDSSTLEPTTTAVVDRCSQCRLPPTGAAGRTPGRFCAEGVRLDRAEPSCPPGLADARRATLTG